MKNILKYLKRTKDEFLVFGGVEELSVKGYTDASFQTDSDDYRSQSGYVFILNRGAVSWKCSKQETVADSTTETEYIAALGATRNEWRLGSVSTQDVLRKFHLIRKLVEDDDI